MASGVAYYKAFVRLLAAEAGMLDQSEEALATLVEVSENDATAPPDASLVEASSTGNNKFPLKRPWWFRGLDDAAAVGLGGA